MSFTTTNMLLIIPSVLTDTGPNYATLIDNAFVGVDAHDHSVGKGVQITPAGMNITSDLSFGSNNATNLRTARLFNNSSISLGVNDKTCLYALNNELYYEDGVGNTVQITAGGALDLGTVSAIAVKDTQFTLEYFGDTSRKVQFSAANIPSSTTRVYSLPTVSANDTLASLTATQTLTATTLTNGIITGCTASNLISGSGQLILNTSGTMTLPNGTDTVVGLALTQTLTNKILTGNTIASFTPNGGANTITVPGVTDTLTVLAASQTLTNKTLTSPVITSPTISGTGTITTGITHVDSSDSSKVLALSLGGATTATKTTLSFSQTTNRTLTFPDLTDNVVTRTSTDTLTNKTLTSPHISTIINGSYTINLPSTDGSGGQVLKTDGSGNWGFTTVATTTGNYASASDTGVTYTSSSNRVQYISTSTVARTDTLATTSILAGDTWTFYNYGTHNITLQSSGSNTVVIVYPATEVTLIANVNTPTTAGNWTVVSLPASQIKGSVSGSDPGTGFIGHQVQASNQGVAVTASSTFSSASNIASISLAPGIYNISCSFLFTGNNSTTYNWAAFAISTVSATPPASQLYGQNTMFVAIDSSRGNGGGSLNPQQLIVSTTTTYYLVAAVFQNSSLTGGNGTITATQVG